MRDGCIADDTRIRLAAQTIRETGRPGARVIVLSHFGRPTGKQDSSLVCSLFPAFCRSVSAGRLLLLVIVSAPVPKKSWML